MSEEARKVGMEECRSVLSLEAWKTAQEVAAALGHDPAKDDGAVSAARTSLHGLAQCRMAVVRTRDVSGPGGGRKPIEFRLTEKGADKAAAAPPAAAPPAATRKAGAQSAAKKGKTRRPYAKPAAQKTETAPPKTAQEITVTLCGDSVVLVRIPERISADTARAIAGVAEFYAERFAVRDDVPFLPLALK